MFLEETKFTKFDKHPLVLLYHILKMTAHKYYIWEYICIIYSYSLDFLRRGKTQEDGRIKQQASNI